MINSLMVKCELIMLKLKDINLNPIACNFIYEKEKHSGKIRKQKFNTRFEIRATFII